MLSENDNRTTNSFNAGKKRLGYLVGKRYGQLEGEEPCADIERLSKADHVGPNCLGMPHFSNLAFF